MTLRTSLKRGGGWISLALGVIVVAFGCAAQLRATVVADPPRAVPTGDYRAHLPLVAMSATRIQGLHALSTTVPRYGKFEVALTISTSATNSYFPYQAATSLGRTGVSVDLLVGQPGSQPISVPCFFYQPVDANIVPIGPPDWRCRFAPDAIGPWTYRVRLSDAIGPVESATLTFTVTASASHGFVRVSPTDSRYFEFDDGTPFLTPLVNVEWGNPLNSLELMRATISTWGQNGVRFVRWLPTGEGANYYVLPYGDELRISWGFGPAYTAPTGRATFGDQFAFEPYFYTGQSVKALEGARYRLSFRARVTGDKVFRPQVGSVVREIRASDWATYTLETTSAGDSLAVLLHDGFSENDTTTGTISVNAINLQRDETDQGGWGPNLLTRGEADTYQYVDQVGAARLDEIMRLSEQSGVYHKLTLFHKNDQVLGRMLPDGSVTEAWDLNHFYSGDGEVARWLEQAYARYFVARWSYSTALHSLELANENMLTPESYDAAYAVLGVVRALQPRHILLSNSFWGYFVADYWADPVYGPLMDYADKHWYAQQVSSGNPTLVSEIYTDSAANVRECQQAFADYRTTYAQDKPIVRGETGVWSDNWQPLDLGSGAATYYHKQLWAQMGDNCGGEWYTAYLGLNNLWGDYLRYEQFLQNEPLTNGQYHDIGSDANSITISASTGRARAWGKLSSAGRGLVWIDNANDTWKNVADGLSVPAATATVTINAVPNGTYQITWFNTATGATSTTTSTVLTGKLTLSVSALAHDVAAQFKRP